MRFWVFALCFAGLISRPALAAEMTFAAVDADGSGLISIEEVEAAGLGWTAEEFAAADTDADEYLNQEEFEVAIAR
jgi:EF hand